MRNLLVFVMLVGVICWTNISLFAAHSDRGCHNCHVPHHASQETDVDGSWGVPLWSNAQTSDGLPTFSIYTRKTFDALGTDIGQPDGASKLCLGCHDGSYSIVSTNADVNFGSDLTRSHPVSFTYDTALSNRTKIVGELRDPSVTLSNLGGTIQQDLLDIKNKMQCVSCHDVHLSGKGATMLRYDWNFDSLLGPKNDQVMCRVCHNK